MIYSLLRIFLIEGQVKNRNAIIRSDKTEIVVYGYCLDDMVMCMREIQLCIVTFRCFINFV